MIDNGFVTTADLSEMGYEHPPRAVADIKDAGIRVERKMVVVDGRRMAQYALAVEVGDESMSGRRQLPKSFRDALFEKWQYRCAMCQGEFTSRELQADHRIPFRLSGESLTLDPADFMPLCPSCNRAKSWSCEGCTNWNERLVSMCRKCLWASPDGYTHIAGRPERRLDIAWTGHAEVHAYDRLAIRAQSDNVSIVDFAKTILAKESDEL